MQNRGGTPSLPNVAPHAMNPDDLERAKRLFEEYNKFREARDMKPVEWSNICANMAYGSAIGCMATHKLTHRLGIPKAYQTSYSDILQYATWDMDPQDAIQRWAASTGHRKMMQCESAKIAGVGVAYDETDGTWYYALVYSFSGINQSGE